MEISAVDFDFVSNLVRGQAAIVLEKGKEYLVDSRLSSLASREGFPSITTMLAAARGSKPGLVQKIVEAMTTNETSFFRDIEPFDILQKQVIPVLRETRKVTRTINIWCAASSTGQEPYSIAMLIREHFPQLADWTVRIIASDISTEVLQRARQGVYGQLEVNRGLAASYLVKYFERKGLDWQIKADIRNMVEFREVNLIRPWPTMPPMDVIFIRNVLIYFDLETKKKIFARLANQLKQDGYIFLGGAETTLNIDDRFGRIPGARSSCYQRNS